MRNASTTWRYIIVGVSVYLFEILVIFIGKQLGLSDIVAVATSFWLGLFVSFLLQKFITFGDRRLHRHVLASQLIAFLVLVLFNFCFTLLVTALVSRVVTPFVARTIALGMTTSWNFYLYRLKIFRTDEPKVY